MTISKACVAELVGTFAFCLIGGGAIMANAMMGSNGGGIVAIALAQGLILAIVISATLHTSGGHVNPAVTFAMMITGRCRPGRAIAYIIAQLLGGLLAGYLLGAVLFKNTTTPDGKDVIADTRCGTPTFDAFALTEIDSPRAVYTPPPHNGETTASQPASAEVETGITATPIRPTPAQEWSAAERATVIEAVMTFLLVFAYFGTTVDPRRPNVGGLGVGLTLVPCILVAWPLTGALLNPARVVGTGFMADPGFWSTAWLVYCVGPVAGASFAAIVYHFLVLDRTAQAE